MGLKSTLKNGVKAGFNLNRWIGMDRIKDDTKTVSKLFGTAIKGSKKSQTTTKPENFEQCMRIHGVDEQGLEKLMHTAKQMITFCLSFAAVLFLYTFYLFFHGLPLASLVTTMLVFVLLAFAFREHFNLYQMKQRRLGCTVKEWFDNLLKGSK